MICVDCSCDFEYMLTVIRSGVYKYSRLSQIAMEQEDNDIENALATHTSLYEDSSDDVSFSFSVYL